LVDFSEIRRSIKFFYENFAHEFSSTRIYPWKEVIRYYKLFERSKTVCDLGCGNGRHTLPLIEVCDHIIGIDISYNLLKIAKNKLNSSKFSPVNADATSLPLRDACIDNIITIAMIHHIPSLSMRRKCVSECRRVLKNNGLLIASVWNLMKPRHLYLSMIQYINDLIHQKRREFGDVYIAWSKKYRRFFHLFRMKEFINLFNQFKIVHYCSFGKGIIKDNNLIIALR